MNISTTLKVGVQQKTCTWIFIASLHAKVSRQKQPTCPHVQWNIILSLKEVLTGAATFKDLKNTVLSKNSHEQKVINSMTAFLMKLSAVNP